MIKIDDDYKETETYTDFAPRKTMRLHDRGIKYLVGTLN